MSSEIEVGIVAAMEREVKPVISDWERHRISGDGRFQTFFRSGSAVLACSGPTKRSAAACTRSLVEQFAPRVLLSVGFAGALTSAMKVPEILIPERIIDAESGKTFATAVGRNVLVTVGRVAARDEKESLAAEWSAVAVDMEAAAVAEVATALGIEFAAVKAISDEANAEMNFVAEYLKPDGFRTMAFLCHVAVRPSLWPAVQELRVNSERATSNLSSALDTILGAREGVLSTLAAMAGKRAELNA